MKNKFKRLLSSLMTVCMLTAMLPASVFAAENVTPVPDSSNGTTTLPVEYFRSTLYNWNEVGANAATEEADFVSGAYNNAQTESGAIKWTDLASSNVTRQATGYYIQLTSDGQYYPTYVTRTTRGNVQYNYTLEYKTADGSYVTVAEYRGYYADSNWPASTTTGCVYIGKDTICLYTGGDYEGKGFYFTNSTGSLTAAIPAFSNWIGGGTPALQNRHIYSGLAESVLSNAANAPFSNENVNAADLFGETVTSETDAWKDVYTNVGVPFVYDAETGYYTMDSDKNAVYFDGGTPEELEEGDDYYGTYSYLMTVADKPAAYTNTYVDTSGSYLTGYQPFVDVSSTEVTAKLSTSSGTTSAYKITNDPVYGFGMKTEIDFQMTDDGTDPLTGDPVTFTFSGDDDVWVYVDGVLALDVGGTHDAIVGTIDFSTGNVTLTAPAYGKIGDKAEHVSGNSWLCNVTGSGVADTESLSQPNLYTDVLSKTLTAFAAEGKHTLTVYYMDRGQGRTNCTLKFNLPQRDTVSVTKVLDSSKDSNGVVSSLTDEEQAHMDNVEFGFYLYEYQNVANEETGEEEYVPVMVTNKNFYMIAPDGTQTKSNTGADGRIVLKNGYTAQFLVDMDNGVQYYVVEESKSGFLTPNYTYTSNVSGTTVTQAANGLTSMTLQATGSMTATDSIAFICENYLDYALPNPSMLPDEDRIVIDYGLPIEIDAEDLLINDTKRGESFEIVGISNTELDDKDTNSFSTSAAGSYGTATLADGQITYTLTRRMDGIERLYYKAQATGKGNEGEPLTQTGIGALTIIPATSMYYEENFGGDQGDATTDSATTTGVAADTYGLITYSKGSVTWTPVGTALTGGKQETGYVGQGLSTYGSDPLYLDNLGDSNGTSMFANANGAAGAQFEYDFVGTGTAIYSRISTESALIQVTITNNDTGDVEDVQYIDTVVLENVAGSEELYNIPVYNHYSLGHGNYHVRVYVYKAGTKTGNEGGSGPEFYLDGIRIYNPLVDPYNEPVEGSDAFEAVSAYAEDTEANTTIINIREKVLADAAAGYEHSIFTLTDIYDSDLTIGDLLTTVAYGDIGPNEELYLYSPTEGTDGVTYSMGFSLVNWSAQYNLYLGMKDPSGAGNVKVQVNSKEYTLNNSPDCYYDISDQVVVTTENLGTEDEPDYVTVGTVEITGVSGLASLTHLKFTGDETFDFAYGEDIEVDEDEVYSLSPNTVYMMRSFSLARDEGVTDEGTTDEGTTDEGTTDEGTTDEGTTDEGTTDEGTTDEGTTDEGTTDEGTTDEGTTDEGTADEGTTDEGTTDEGTADEGTTDEGTTDEGTSDEGTTDEDVTDETPVFVPERFDVTVEQTGKKERNVVVSVEASRDVAYVTVDGIEVNAKRSRGNAGFRYVAKYVQPDKVFEVVAYNADGVASEVYLVSMAAEEEDVFVPERFEIEVDHRDRKRGTALKIQASNDVAYITVNGEEIYAQKGRGGYKFTFTARKAFVGETFEVVAYNKDGVASETYVVAR